MRSTVFNSLSEPAPPRPTLARRVGITVGVLVLALVLLGQGIFLVTAVRNGLSASDEAPPQHGTLSQRVHTLLAEVLGPGDRGVPRFRVSIGPHMSRRSIALHVTWAINNDLSGGTVGNGAAMDVYAMLRALYTSGLPVSSVHLNGTYPLPDRNGRLHEKVVMRLALDRQEAARIAEAGWDNVDAVTLWPLLTRLYVNPQLQPLSNE